MLTELTVSSILMHGLSTSSTLIFKVTMFRTTAVTRFLSSAHSNPLWWKLLLEASSCKACSFSLNPTDLLSSVCEDNNSNTPLAHSPVQESSIQTPMEILWDHYLDGHSTDDFHQLVPPNLFAAMILGLLTERKRNWIRQGKGIQPPSMAKVVGQTEETPLLDLVMVHNTSGYELQVVEDELFHSVSVSDPFPIELVNVNGLSPVGIPFRPHPHIRGRAAPWSVAILWTPHFRRRELMEHWRGIYFDKLQQAQEQERFSFSEHDKQGSALLSLPLPLVTPPYGEASLEPMGYSCLDALSRIQFHLCSSYAYAGEGSGRACNPCCPFHLPSPIRVGLITPDRSLRRDAVRFFGGHPTVVSSSPLQMGSPSSVGVAESSPSLGSDHLLQIYPVDLESKEWCRNWTPKSSS